MSKKKAAGETAYEAVMRQAERDREDARRYRELMERLRELAHDLRSVFSRAELEEHPARVILDLAKGVK